MLCDTPRDPVTFTGSNIKENKLFQDKNHPGVFPTVLSQPPAQSQTHARRTGLRRPASSAKAPQHHCPWNSPHLVHTDRSTEMSLSSSARQIGQWSPQPSIRPSPGQGQSPPPLLQPPGTLFFPPAGTPVAVHPDTWTRTQTPQHSRAPRLALPQSAPSPAKEAVRQPRQPAAVRSWGPGEVPSQTATLRWAAPGGPPTPWGPQTCRGSCTSAEVRSWS